MLSRKIGAGRGIRTSFTHPVFEFVGILVFLLVEVNEVMGDPLQVTVFHGPGDTERVTSDIIDLDAVGGGQQFHGPLWCGSCGDQEPEERLASPSHHRAFWNVLLPSCFERWSLSPTHQTLPASLR